MIQNIQVSIAGDEIKKNDILDLKYLLLIYKDLHKNLDVFYITDENSETIK